MLIINGNKAKVIPECEKCSNPMYPMHFHDLEDWKCINCQEKEDLIEKYTKLIKELNEDINLNFKIFKEGISLFGDEELTPEQLIDGIEKLVISLSESVMHIKVALKIKEMSQNKGD